MTVDLGPAAEQTAAVVRGVGDDQLDLPTPCSAYTVADLLDHVGGLSLAFAAAATKVVDDDLTGAPPQGDGSRLGEDWRTRIPPDVLAVAEAWRDPEAWSGMTRAGAVDLPGEVAGVVALNELVVHGWDLARATGQRYECDHATLEACHGFVMMFSGPGSEDQRGDAFGPVVDVPEDAPLLDQVIGLNGRDPAWPAVSGGTAG
jgi:uncharacterized protein (TIGR03086 family)